MSLLINVQIVINNRHDPTRAVRKIHRPVEGHRYRVSETNRDFHAWTYPALIQEVVTHLQSNGLPVPPDLEAKIQEYTCQGLGPDWCVEDDPRRSWFAGARLTFGVIMAGTKTLGSWLLKGLPKVSQEQADARSEVCAGCIANRPIEDCIPCRMPIFHTLVAGLIGDARASRHQSLRACSACGCSLAVKVWVPLEHILKSFPTTPDAYPASCWILKERDG